MEQETRAASMTMKVSYDTETNALKIQLRSPQDGKRAYRRQSVGGDENVVVEFDVEPR